MSMWQDNVKPMLIGEESIPFSDPDYIYEPYLHGTRCIAYIDPKYGVDMLGDVDDDTVRELRGIYKSVKAHCILDGVIISHNEGRKCKHKYMAVDLLFYRHPIVNISLAGRKILLKRAIKRQTDKIGIVEHVEELGVPMYAIATHKGFDGAVAKRLDSRYYPGETTSEWIRIVAPR